MTAFGRQVSHPLIFSLFVYSALGLSCARRPAVAADVSVEWTMTPTPPIVGGATRGEVALRDGAHRPVRGAKLLLEAHMSHPGMAPMIAPITERGDGVYEVPLQFAMAGDWILLVTGVLPDGRTLNHRVDIAIRPAG